MPELPEVETIRRTIWLQVEGRTIDQVDVVHTDVVAGVSPQEFAVLLTDARMVGLDRRGKYLILRLERAEPPSPVHVLVHLRMTGKLSTVARGEQAPAHTHLRLALDDGRDLLFTDTRRFGRWTVLGCAPDGQEDGPAGFRSLGPEPLDAGFDREMFAAGLAKRRGKLKAVLLDQCFVAGIGNIYADEILHRARLHPLRPADSLQPEEVARLFDATQAVLAEAIGKGGTTIRDYVDGSGRKGDFVYSLRVYGRTGEECRAAGCGAKIERIVVAGRSTHFCPRCQPPPPDGI